MKRALIVIGLLVCLAPRAGAEPNRQELREAKRRFARANELYDQGRYEEALRLYLAAHDLVPSLDILFNIGLAKEKVLDPEGCAVSFQEYLEEAPEDDPLRDRAEAGLERCRERARIPVRISSIPAGAAIRLGEEGKAVFRGRTPRDLELAPGEYRIAVELPGYVALAQEVRVKIGSRPEVDFPLEKLSSLSIEANVSGARAVIDGGEPESLPIERQVRAGTYEIRVFKEGFREVRRKVQVEPGEQSTLVLSLPPLPVKREVRVEADTEARVLVAGEDVGETPLALELPPGRHRVRVVAEGRIPFARNITLSEERDLELDVRLARERTDTERAVFWSLLGGAGASAVAASIFGALALGDKSEFQDVPSIMTADRGRSRARTADLLWSTSFALAAGAALQYLATSRDSKASLR